MPIDPATLPGKRLWIRAKDQTGASGTAVTSIADQSGAGNNPTSISGVTTVTGVTPSGGRVLRLANATINLPNLGLGTADYEMFMVVKSATVVQNAWKFGGSGSQNHYLYDTDIYSDFGETGRRNFTPPAGSVSSAFRLYRPRSETIDGTVWHREYLEETLYTNISGVVRSWTTSPWLANTWSGDIAECLILPPTDQATRNGLVDYFNAEHGLSLTAGGPADPPRVDSRLDAIYATVLATEPSAARVAAVYAVVLTPSVSVPQPIQYWGVLNQ